MPMTQLNRVSLEKGHYEALNSLESPMNLYRVIFAVARLTEGWDVLNLFDIVRLSDEPESKRNESNNYVRSTINWTWWQGITLFY